MRLTKKPFKLVWVTVHKEIIQKLLASCILPYIIRNLSPYQCGWFHCESPLLQATSEHKKPNLVYLPQSILIKSNGKINAQARRQRDNFRKIQRHGRHLKLRTLIASYTRHLPERWWCGFISRLLPLSVATQNNALKTTGGGRRTQESGPETGQRQQQQQQ